MMDSSDGRRKGRVGSVLRLLSVISQQSEGRSFVIGLYSISLQLRISNELASII